MDQTALIIRVLEERSPRHLTLQSPGSVATHSQQRRIRQFELSFESARDRTALGAFIQNDNDISFALAGLTTEVGV
jgi:hypothetical protein